jgi:hypothetical protein
MFKFLCKLGWHKYGPIIITTGYVHIQRCARCGHVTQVPIELREYKSKFKVGDYVHNGYVRMQILRESEIKGYRYVVKFVPTPNDCRGARSMAGHVRHVSEKEFELKCKKVE